MSRKHGQPIADVILEFTGTRGPDKSICPSDAARRLAGSGGDWRTLMEDVRRVAGELAREGRIEVTQQGVPVNIEEAVGPVRLRTARHRLVD